VRQEGNHQRNDENEPLNYNLNYNNNGPVGTVRRVKANLKPVFEPEAFALLLVNNINLLTNLMCMQGRRSTTELRALKSSCFLIRIRAMCTELNFYIYSSIV